MTIIELHEETQQFHFNYIINGEMKNEINTFGWQKLFVCKSDYEAHLFCDYLTAEYIKKGKKMTLTDCKNTLDNLINFTFDFISLNSSNA
jgi:hypothetical protein